MTGASQEGERARLLAELEQWDIVEATFQPKRTDNLKPEAAPFIGQRHRWRPLWRCEPDETYPGQWAFSIDVGPGIWPMGWVPEEDLADIVMIDRRAPWGNDPQLPPSKAPTTDPSETP